ncbi:A/G-specific adenine glycosylase [Bacteroidia bacterium]|nr:A/G-specific adenine glycosylase [Bacteroidia bacterium]
MKNCDFIAAQLIEWYSDNRRDLPWRNTSDPYKIWISEIILQQTRVAQGLEYYNRFVERFPDVQALASADEQEVLKLWQGLGYYSRARNLHLAAKTIFSEYNAVFPKDYQAVLNLKGIGEYTAAAIVSFAWNMPYPVVDGNVFRFLSRLFAINEPIDTNKGKKQFTELAGKLMDKTQAGLFNQAIMEFGALQCTPASPDCPVCPFQSRCPAYATNSVEQFPVKQNKTQTKDLYLYYFHIHDGRQVWINQRHHKGIWQNLFEFPLIEAETSLSFEQLSEIIRQKSWLPGTTGYSFRLIIENKKHILSHRILHASFYEVHMEKLPAITEFISIDIRNWEEYPLHRLMQYYLETTANGKSYSILKIPFAG